MKIKKSQLKRIIREEMLRKEMLSEGAKMDMIVKGLTKFKDQALPAIKAFFEKNPDLIDDATALLKSLTGKGDQEEAK